MNIPHREHPAGALGEAPRSERCNVEPGLQPGDTASDHRAVAVVRQRRQCHLRLRQMGESLVGATEGSEVVGHVEMQRRPETTDPQRVVVVPGAFVGQPVDGGQRPQVPLEGDPGIFLQVGELVGRAISLVNKYLSIVDARAGGRRYVVRPPGPGHSPGLTSARPARPRPRRRSRSLGWASGERVRPAGRCRYLARAGDGASARSKAAPPPPAPARRPAGGPPLLIALALVPFFGHTCDHE